MFFKKIYTAFINSFQGIYRALKDAGVYVDWRKPNVMRIAPVPLYNSFEDIAKFHNILFTCI